MNDLLLAICSCLSCFIIATIIFQYMNDRYKRTFQNKFVYYLIEIATIIIISIINLLGIAILNLLIWIFAIIFISYILYFDENSSPVRRIIECEVLFIYIAVCETLGFVFVNWVLDMFGFDLQTGTMQSCIQVTFSKVIVIFMYYLVFTRLMSKRKNTFTKVQWAINIIIMVYSFINMIVIAEGVAYGQESFILLINMGCIVLADLYLLYFIKVSNDKNQLEGEVKILEQQANIQYEYYVQQEQKYNQTIQILHDVNKHIMSIENLYANGENDTATEYVKEINNILKPLTPIKYTGNPILDIVLTDKAAVGKEKGIRFDISVDNADLDFLDTIDVTTIFGNLIDNAIEAAEKANGDKFIRLKLSSFQDMVILKMENSSLPVKMKNGVPVSDKGKKHGIGLLNVKRSIEKYDGNITFKQQNNIFTVDLLLNS